MTQHTPGPWKADDRSDWYPWPETFGICAGERTIAWTTADAAHRDRDIADAHLMAAAPDMLEAISFAKAANRALEGYERDLGERLPDDYEIGRIDDSRESASFRIRVGHIRKLVAALTKATAVTSDMG